MLQWIVSALYGGYIASNVLKWHWWRFNANGFFYGMLSGILSAMIFSLIIPSVQLLYWFPVLFAISLGARLSVVRYSANGYDRVAVILYHRKAMGLLGACQGFGNGERSIICAQQKL